MLGMIGSALGIVIVIGLAVVAALKFYGKI